MCVRMPSLRALVLVGASLLAVARTPLSAQATAKQPRRPKVEADMDTNEAQAYLLVGQHQLEKQPEVAKAAFYWAARIDPGSAPAYYGLRVATTMAEDGLVRMFWYGTKNARDRADLRTLDSLDMRAELLDPFLQPTLMRTLIARTAEVEGMTPQDLGTRLANAGPLAFAQMSMFDGRYDVALESFAKLIKRDVKGTSYYHAMRGRLFQYLGNADSAFGSLKRAIAEAKKVEDTALVRFYQPKARYLYQMGWLHESLDRPNEARDAYGLALVEDLSFYPAHQRLALLALAQGDTTTAISEFDMAVQAGSHDVVLRVQYAYALAATRKLAEASQQIQQVIAKEPYYADPYLMLARLYDATQMSDLAAESYKAFLERAPKADLQRQFAADRVQALAGTASKAPEQR